MTSEIETRETEACVLRARVHMLEVKLAAELAGAKAVVEMLVEERNTAIKAYRELLLKYDRMEERCQK